MPRALLIATAIPFATIGVLIVFSPMRPDPDRIGALLHGAVTHPRWLQADPLERALNVVLRMGPLALLIPAPTAVWLLARHRARTSALPFARAVFRFIPHTSSESAPWFLHPVLLANTSLLLICVGHASAVTSYGNYSSTISLPVHEVWSDNWAKATHVSAVCLLLVVLLLALIQRHASFGGLPARSRIALTASSAIAVVSMVALEWMTATIACHWTG